MKIQAMLLRLYPREWRARYEQEFMALLEQDRTSILDLADVAWGALDAHMRPQVAAAKVASERRPIMEKARLVQWGGLAAMAGSLLFLPGWAGLSIFADNEYPYTTDLVDILCAAAFLTSVVLLLMGALAIGAAYARRSGVPGQAGIVIAVVGLVTALVGAGGQMAETMGTSGFSWWGLLMIGLFGQCTGMALFAASGLRQRLISPTGGYLIVAGTAGAIGAALFSIAFAVQGPETVLMAIEIVSIALFMMGVCVLGFLLWNRRDARSAQPDVLAAKA